MDWIDKPQNYKDLYGILQLYRCSWFEMHRTDQRTPTVQVRDKRPTHTQNARTFFAQTRVKKRVPLHAFARICAHMMRVFPFVIHSHNYAFCGIVLHNRKQG